MQTSVLSDLELRQLRLKKSSVACRTRRLARFHEFRSVCGASFSIHTSWRMRERFIAKAEAIDGEAAALHGRVPLFFTVEVAHVTQSG